MLRFMARHGRRILVTLLPLFLLGAHALGLFQFSLINRLDDFFYDVRLNLTRPGTLDERIVIVDIDEKSLAELGHWPWGRDKLARLTRQIFDHYHAAALGFDVLFSETDNSSGLPVLQDLARDGLRGDATFLDRLRAMEPELDYDRRFAEALRGRPVVLGYYFTSDHEGRRKGRLPSPVLGRPDQPPLPPLQVLDWDGYGANLDLLAQAVPQAGFFNSITDEDGVVRSLPLLARHEGRYYESLALALLREYQGRPALHPVIAPGNLSGDRPLEALQLGEGQGALRIPLDDRGALLVPYRGAGGPHGGSFRYLSAADVLAGRVAPGALAGRLVLVGATAPGLLDLRATPVGQIYPGVEAHASVISGLLDRRLPVRPDYAGGCEMLVLVVVGLTLALVLPLLGASWALLLSLGMLVGVMGLNVGLYLAAGLVFPLASAVLLVLLAFALNMSYGYFVESRAKRELADVFGTYVPPELVEQMLQDPERYSMKAASRELTVMFCDMRGFTRLSEGLEPAQLQALLNQLFSRLSQCIRRHQGTIDKYMGDCVMAFWGAPVELPDHAERAVAAALDMVAEVEAFNREQQSRGQPTVAVGIGLNTGLMRVGDMGSDLRRSYTVIGDAVNLGSRLEGLSKRYGLPIIASESTRKQADPARPWQALDRVRVQGKEDAVSIFAPVAPGGQTALALWADMLKAYRAHHWQEAEQYLADLQAQEAWPTLCLLYQRRLADFRQNPPPDTWDGVSIMDSK
ncbi:MAG: adenylate/guanylate cyclase domain-containing protein [Curvibacter sp.]|nr:adenylate/guanylate cyclase domain-containing protein [Curvibacter sp.]